MKQVILLRHGETEHNLQRIFQADGARLSNAGRAQVTDAAKSRDLKHINLILHSPILRATETAEIIASIAKVPMEVSELLIEFKNPPHIRGKSYDDPEADALYRAWIGQLESPEGLNDDDVENYIDLYRRTGSALRMLFERSEDSILAVSHSEIIRAVVAHVVLGDCRDVRLIAGVMKALKLGNACYVKLIYDEGKMMWRVLL